MEASDGTRAPAKAARSTGVERRGADRREPAWLFLLAGWLLARTAFLVAGARRGPELDFFPMPGSPPLPPIVDALRAGPPAIDLERSPPRVLRRLPGIGRRRAVDLAQARWERTGGEPLELRSIRGIGPKTEARVLARLAEEEGEEAGESEEED